MPKITIDHNDNIWCFGWGTKFGVWIDDQWTQLDRSDFGGSNPWVIKEAPDHKIWIGNEHGIYISKKDPLIR